MPIRRWTLALAVTAPLIVGLVAPEAQARPIAPAPASVAQAVASDPAAASAFVERVNSLRASKGLSALQVSGALDGIARGWTDQMAAAGRISHNPSLSTQVSSGWTKLGENVGVGYDVDGLMAAFIGSPAHYANLVDPAWTHIGVGVTVTADGRMYTTHDFMALGGSPPPPAAPPTTAPPPPPAPVAPVTTTTTAPPPPPPPPPEPHPTPARVTAVLDPLRSLEAA